MDFRHLAIDGQRFPPGAGDRRSKTRKPVKASYCRVGGGIVRLLEKESSEEFTEEKKGRGAERLRRQEKQLLGLKKMLEGLADKQATVNMTNAEAPLMKHKDGRKLPS